MPETQLDPLPTGKICRKCGTAKPVSEFTRKKATQDGLDLYCRSCKAEKGKAERERRRNQKQKNKQKTHRQSKIISQTDPIVDNVHMVNLGPIMDRLKHHFEEARKIIQFLDVLQETTGARIDIPKFEE